MNEKDADELKEAHLLLWIFLRRNAQPEHLEIAKLKLERIMLRNNLEPVFADKEPE